MVCDNVNNTFAYSLSWRCFFFWEEKTDKQELLIPKLGFLTYTLILLSAPFLFLFAFPSLPHVFTSCSLLWFFLSSSFTIPLGLIGEIGEAGGRGEVAGAAACMKRRKR